MQWEGQPPSTEEIIKKVRDTLKGKRYLIYVVIAVVVSLWLASGIYTVAPDEEGVVRRFGKQVSITSPGLRYHLPWPVEVADTPKVTAIQRLEIGFRTTDPGPPARYQFVEAESLMLTGDENIVDAQVIVQFKIKNPSDYLFKVKDVRGTLMDASEAALREVIGGSSIDDVLTVGRFQIQAEVKSLLQEIMDSYESGLLITDVKLQTVRPPKEVEGAFKDVVSAKEDRERLIYEAKGYQEDIIPKAKGRAMEIVREAEGYKEQRIKRAQGDAMKFLAVLKEYEKAKDVTLKRLYLETMEEVLPGVKKFVIDNKVGGNLLQFLPLGEQSKSRILPQKTR